MHKQNPVGEKKFMLMLKKFTLCTTKLTTFSKVLFEGYKEVRSTETGVDIKCPNSLTEPTAGLCVI